MTTNFMLTSYIFDISKSTSNIWLNIYFYLFVEHLFVIFWFKWIWCNNWLLYYWGRGNYWPLSIKQYHPIKFRHNFGENNGLYIQIISTKSHVSRDFNKWVFCNIFGNSILWNITNLYQTLFNSPRHYIGCFGIF